MDERVQNKEEIRAFTVELLLSAELDESVGIPARIAAFDDGYIIYDNALKQIQTYNQENELIRAFGSNGSGPGEFQSVSALNIHSDTISVSDPELLRITSFNLDGDLMATQELPSSVWAFHSDIVTPLRFIIPTNGQEDGLAKFVDRSSHTEFVFGEPVTTPTEVADFNQWRSDISAGRVPDFFRNSVAVSGSERFIYLFLQTERTLQQYDSDGTLLWSRELDLPELDDEFQYFLERNRDNQSPSMYMLQYVSSMEQREEGLYLLLNIPDTYSPTLVFVNHAGDIERKMTFEGMDAHPNHFSMSPDGEWIYFIDYTAGAVYRSSLHSATGR